MSFELNFINLNLYFPLSFFLDLTVRLEEYDSVLTHTPWQQNLSVYTGDFSSGHKITVFWLVSTAGAVSSITSGFPPGAQYLRCYPLGILSAFSPSTCYTPAQRVNSLFLFIYCGQWSGSWKKCNHFPKKYRL